MVQEPGFLPLDLGLLAPGQVQKLSVGIVVNDGTKTHAPAPNVPQLTQLELLAGDRPQPR